MTTNHGHGGPDDMDDFNFDDLDGTPPAPAHGAAPRPSGPTGHGFDSGDFDFEAPPQPADRNSRTRTAPVTQHDDFADLPDDEGQDAHHHDASLHTAAGISDGADYAAQDEGTPVGVDASAPSSDKTLVQKYWFPAALCGLGAVGLFGAYEMGFLGGNSTPQQAPAMVQTAQQVPVVPQGAPPRVPQSPPVLAPVTPTMPATTNTPPMGGFGTPAATPSGGVEAAVNRMVDATKNLNATLDTRFSGLELKLGQVQTAISTRLDATDGKVTEVHGQVTAVEGRIGDVESRLSALETGRTAGTVRPASLGGGINQRARMPTPAPQAAEPAARALPGFALRGVARGAVPDSAYVQVPGGQFFLVHIGDNLPGAGEVASIRRDGANWVLTTNQGVIRP